MVIPKDLTHAEVGCFLMAIGQHMLDNDVCAEAVLDEGLLEDIDYAEELAEVMHNVNDYEDMPKERCLEIIRNLKLDEAVAYVHPSFLREPKTEAKTEDDENTYRIQRFYRDPNKVSETIKEGLTLVEAKEHCSSPDSEGDGWFDGFEME